MPSTYTWAFQLRIRQRIFGGEAIEEPALDAGQYGRYFREMF